MPHVFPLEQIEEILRACPEYEDGHHLGRPYMSAYQLAIAFSERHPEHQAVRALPIGGAGTAAHESLAQQIARFLSQSIAQGNSEEIEGAFISHLYMGSLTFNAPGRAPALETSTLRAKPAHSIFRLRERHAR